MIFVRIREMDNFEKEIKDIQTLNIEEVQELRDYYLKTATLFSSRSKIGTAHIYYALARECLKHKKELEKEAYEKA